jgi:hypothetical protein
MEEIEVTARFDSKGSIIPLTFSWQDRTYKVDAIGRNWQASDGLHILVMDARNQAFHLIFNPEITQWYLLRSGDVPTVPRV